MAKIFKPASRVKNRKHQSAAKQLPQFELEIEKYDHELKGIGTGLDGRITFVPDVMVGEKVKIKPQTYTERVIHGEVLSQLTVSEDRITPHCAHFNECGGCQLQYMTNQQQLDEKQNALDAVIRKQLKVDVLPWQAAIGSDDWNYRRTARMVTWREKSGDFQMGFRAKGDKRVVDIDTCPILTTKLAAAFSALKPILSQFKPTKAFPHVVGFDLEQGVTLVIRAMRDLASSELEALSTLASELNCQIWLETDKGKYQSIDSQQANFLLEYEYNEYRYTFSPSDFIQINTEVNHGMIKQALDWLDVQREEIVMDLFSGVGNFTLPLASNAKSVFAVEGVSNMVARLKHNAQINGLDNISAHQADLSQIDDKRRPRWLKPIDKLLLDPARDGALDVVKKIPLLSPKAILYVSCNPVTMARDLKYLLTNDYRLTKIGLLNMFPHTSHVEAMALLEKDA